jgi:protein involved in polysaccharide export with SLBB domain
MMQSFSGFRLLAALLVAVVGLGGCAGSGGAQATGKSRSASQSAPVAPVGAAAAAPGDSAAASAAPAAGQGARTTAESYRLDAGDKVRITVFNETNLSGEFEIDGKGSLAYPLVGTIEAQGLTPRQLEQAIINRLNQGYLRDPSVSVEVLSYRPFYILGEVRTPGSYPYVNDMTVLNAVALAGGYTYRARTGSAVIKRAGSPAEETVEPTTQVFPGDVITIKERYF